MEQLSPAVKSDQSLCVHRTRPTTRDFKSRNRKQFIKQPLQEEERWLKALEAYIEKRKSPLDLRIDD